MARKNSKETNFAIEETSLKPALFSISKLAFEENGSKIPLRLDFLFIISSTTNLDPDPSDWRQDSFPMAYYELTNGSTIGFRYGSIDGNELREVGVPLPATAISVLFTNNSWCWDAEVKSVLSHCFNMIWRSRWVRDFKQKYRAT